VKWSDTTRRCSGRQALNRVFINRLREVLWGYEPLYPEGQGDEVERFFIPPQSFGLSDGRTRPALHE
jgi:hypothetical protein